jgi:hypothetical protein
MNLPIIHAEAGLETIIYMIVVVLWVVGNVLSKSKKKNGRRTTPVPRAGESTAETELREFLENLAGKPEADEQETEVQPPRPTPRVRPRRERPPHHRASPPVTPAPILRVLPPLDQPAMDIEQAVRELRDGAPSMAGSFSTTLNSGGTMFRSAGLGMPSFGFALRSARPRPAKPVITRDALNEKNELRRMLTGRILLGPPRAVDPYDFQGERKD